MPFREEPRKEMVFTRRRVSALNGLRNFRSLKWLRRWSPHANLSYSLDSASLRTPGGFGGLMLGFRHDPGGSRRLAQAQLDAHTGRSRHIHQRLKGEAVDPAANQVRDVRLGHAEEPGGLGPVELGVGNMLLQGHRECRAQLHVLRLLGGLLDRIPDTVIAFAGHERDSLINLRICRAANLMSESRVFRVRLWKQCST